MGEARAIFEVRFPAKLKRPRPRSASPLHVDFARWITRDELPLRTDLCRSPTILGGGCPAQTCHPRRFKGDGWITRVLAAKALRSAVRVALVYRLPSADTRKVRDRELGSRFRKLAPATDGNQNQVAPSSSARKGKRCAIREHPFVETDTIALDRQFSGDRT